MKTVHLKILSHMFCEMFHQEPPPPINLLYSKNNFIQELAHHYKLPLATMRTIIYFVGVHVFEPYPRAKNEI